MCTSVRNKVSCKVGFGKIHPSTHGSGGVVCALCKCVQATKYHAKLGLLKDSLHSVVWWLAVSAT